MTPKEIEQYIATLNAADALIARVICGLSEGSVPFDALIDWEQAGEGAWAHCSPSMRISLGAHCYPRETLDLLLALLAGMSGDDNMLGLRDSAVTVLNTLLRGETIAAETLSEYGKQLLARSRSLLRQRMYIEEAAELDLISNAYSAARGLLDRDDIALSAKWAGEAVLEALKLSRLRPQVPELVALALPRAPTVVDLVEASERNMR